MVTDRASTYRTLEWLSDVGRLRYSDYWNDESEEEQKPFWVLNGDFRSMELYLERSRLPAQLETCVSVARGRFDRTIKGVGIDLAAGSLWAVPHLFRLGAIDLLYCVEYSRHRLLKLGPAVLERYGAPIDHIVLAIGDVHDVHLPDGSADFVLLSAAFHHSDTPGALLREIRRILKPTGVVLIIGEHITDAGLVARLRHMAKFIAAKVVPHALQSRLFGRQLVVDRFVPREEDLLVGDSRLGDHAYTLDQYLKLFREAGFASQSVRQRDWSYQAFVLAPEEGAAS